jgi:hypothetical protein
MQFEVKYHWAHLLRQPDSVVHPGGRDTTLHLDARRTGYTLESKVNRLLFVGLSGSLSYPPNQQEKPEGGIV